MSSYDPDRVAHQEIPNFNIQLNPEELAVLKECNREGFYKRGVPIAGLFGVGAMYAIKTGMIKSHAKYGSLPAIGMASLLGCIVGSISYKAVCLQRVLAVPNGTLRQQLETALQSQKNPGAIQKSEFPETYPVEKSPWDLESQGPMISGAEMESYHSTNSFDGFSGVNDHSRNDSSRNFESLAPLPKFDGPHLTYDQLREANRREYERATTTRLSPQAPRRPPLPRTQPAAPPEDDENGGFSTGRSRYDRMD